MDCIMSTLKKLCTSFIRAQMWKQYNKLRTVNTADMDVEELTTHRPCDLLKMILTLPPKIRWRFRMRMMSRISMCCILN
jgi:hypothetical protein